jgi:hypothetical protein
MRLQNIASLNKLDINARRHIQAEKTLAVAILRRYWWRWFTQREPDG